MCAINGVWGGDKTLVAAMNAATRHRGPDATGIWSNGTVTLGSNRLAIIDLSSDANQPMISASGRYVIAFNGEIFNYQALRAELAGSYAFKTHSDTEVILAFFEREGIDALARLHGMFAIALWDNKNQQLILARDRSGIKPLYYGGGEAFAFSSELKGLLANPRQPRVINHAALERYLRMRYVPGEESIIVGVHKLPAGHYCVVKNGRVESVSPFATVPLTPPVGGSVGEVEEKVRGLVDASVARQLVADRPVGIFLSGGLDSTIVLDAALKKNAATKTFSLGFELDADEDPAKFNADALLARQTAAHYGTEHHETLFTEAEFLKLLPEAAYYLDQPLANATAVAQLALSRFAREHIVVALTGEGGDELFGGYPRYRLNLLMDYWQRLPDVLRRPLGGAHSGFEKLNTPPGVQRIARFMFEKDEALSRVIAPAFAAGMISDRPADWFAKEYLGGDAADSTQLFMDADRRSWLVDEALERADTMSMAASLELRVPLLDEDIVAYASRLPSRMRVGLRGGKKILRGAFAGRLPPHVLQAKKRGFFSPAAKWMRRPAVLALVREALSPGFHPGTDALLDFKGVAEMLDAHVEKRAYAMTTLWTLVALRLWAKSYNATL